MAKAPSPPFIQAAQHGGDNNKPIHRIVMHATVSPCEPGGARNIANYFANLSGTYASAHYVVDPKEVIQCVNDWTVAYQAPPNEHSLGIELCDPQEGPDSRWDDANHVAMLKLAAKLAQQLAKAYGVPVVWRSPAQLTAGKQGFTDHDNVSNAWGQTDHTDPGWSSARSDAFIKLVKAGGGGTIGAKIMSWTKKFKVSDWAVKAGVADKGHTMTARGYLVNAWQQAKQSKQHAKKILDGETWKIKIPTSQWARDEGIAEDDDHWAQTLVVGAWQHAKRNGNYLRDVQKQQSVLLKAIKDSGVDVDEEAIAESVLKGLDTRDIAKAIIKAMPADQARKIVDELSERLS